MAEGKIYNRDKDFSTVVNRIKNSEMNGNNKQTILDFINYLLSSSISKVRILRYLHVLKQLDKQLSKDFKTVNVDDMRRVIGEIQLKEDYSVWTKHSSKVCIKRFYKFINGDEEYPATVKWIRCLVKKSEIKLPSEGELLTEKEVDQLIKVSLHPRDKAFISMLWESGCRIAEIGELKIKDIAFDEHGFTIMVSGKTGMRRIKLISSTPYLSTWLDSHPYKNNPNSQLWLAFKGHGHKPILNYVGFQKLIVRAFRNAGINKRCNPHFFRHSRATFLANHLTEFQMNQYFGWVQGSDMPSTYVHMSGKEIDNRILEIHGIKAEKKTESDYKPRKCPRCNVINNHDTKLCINCAFILDEQEAMKVQKQRDGELKGNELMNELMKDPEVQKLLTKKISEMGLFGKMSE